MSDSEASVRSQTNGRASSAIAKPPGAQIRRRATGQQKPNSTRAAGAGGSSGTMLKLYTDDSPGLRVDPFVVLILSLSFIASIFFLHISAKIIRSFAK
ncbi:Pre protein translocase Sec Sec61-beta subunit [Coniophora puteana RWD-64-598 SS2]|uniref:Pre protein translocase Sec Sec61-beta subunit n=1 Tax=Coniophora puteana (strain RWD-64-598) TaxID=741705 RepID=A0A5M3M8Z1_CONPW|nr:Pre protein translocase Sec Sec61-beta subunit [Coniophora puteana RWD-64-598 SS2]EIW75547.1 Pre protein translocase Sec Sec61-beta subunit [Coniophora puteana RWD-64-598 SS2]